MWEYFYSHLPEEQVVSGNFQITEAKGLVILYFIPNGQDILLILFSCCVIGISGSASNCQVLE